MSPCSGSIRNFCGIRDSRTSCRCVPGSPRRAEGCPELESPHWRSLILGCVEEQFGGTVGCECSNTIKPTELISLILFLSLSCNYWLTFNSVFRHEVYFHSPVPHQWLLPLCRQHRKAPRFQSCFTQPGFVAKSIINLHNSECLLLLKPLNREYPGKSISVSPPKCRSRRSVNADGLLHGFAWEE